MNIAKSTRGRQKSGPNGNARSIQPPTNKARTQTTAGTSNKSSGAGGSKGSRTGSGSSDKTSLSPSPARIASERGLAPEAALRGIKEKEKEKKKEDESNFHTQKIRTLLEKLKDQARENKYRVTDFEKKEQMPVELNKCRDILSDICKILNNRCAEENKRASEHQGFLNAVITEVDKLFSTAPPTKSKKRDKTKAPDENSKESAFLDSIKSGIEEFRSKIHDTFVPLKDWRKGLSPENIKKLKRTLKPITADSRELDKITETKELQAEFMIVASETNDELKKLEEKITAMWKTAEGESSISQIKKSTNITASLIADRLHDRLIQNKDEIDKLNQILEKMKSEIGYLENDIRDWDKEMKYGMTRIDQQSHDVLRATREARKQLNAKKEECRKEALGRTTERDGSEQALRKKALAVRKHILGTSGNLSQASGTDNDEVTKMLEDINTQLPRLEAAAFNIEGGCAEILSITTGIQSDEEQTSSLFDLVITSEKNVTRCKTEMKLLQSTIKHLEKVIMNNETDKSILGKCKSMTDTVTRWKTDNVRTRSVIDNATTSLSKTYSTLVDEPYKFCELSRDTKSNTNVPDWMQQFTEILVRLELCVEENKLGFNERFLEMDTVKPPLKDIYMLVLKKEYSFPDEDDRSTKGSKKNSNKSQQGSSRSADSSLVVEDMLLEIQDGFKQRFLEVESIKPQIEEIYLIVLKKEYIFPDEDGRSTKTGKNRSQSKMSKSADSGVAVTDMLLGIRDGLSKTMADFEENIINLKMLKSENQGLLTRLSAVAGARLTDNNPNIADLSDTNRPTKIAEFYSELYDNEWTEAYEVLEKGKMSTENALHLLYTILSTVYQECGKYAERQDFLLRTILVCPTAELSFTETIDSKGSKTKQMKVDLPAVLSKNVSELRKQSVTECSKDITKCIKTKFEKWFKGKALGEYTLRCITLCWLMQVQTQPVHIDTDEKVGLKFEKDKYKEYTKSGKKVDYVVWPPLCLTKGGAILSKGVAQGK